MAASDSCPKCSFPRQAQALECPRCGIIFLRWARTKGSPIEQTASAQDDPFHWVDELGEPPLQPPPPPQIPWLAGQALVNKAAPEQDDSVDWSHSVPLGNQEAMDIPMEMTNPLTRLSFRPNQAPESIVKKPFSDKAFASGVFMGLIIYMIPLARFILDHLVTLVHEMGHTLLYWGFSEIAIPAFDFINGGGVTGSMGRSYLLLLIIVLAMSYPFFMQRQHPRMLRNWALLLLSYAALIFTPIHDLIVAAGGHLMELVWASLCFYRALSGRDLKKPVERPLYALIGSFTLVSDLALFGKLMYSDAFRAEYTLGKAGMVSDLDQVAAYLHMETSTVASFFMLTTLAVIPITLYLVKDEQRERLLGRIKGFFVAQPG